MLVALAPLKYIYSYVQSMLLKTTACKVGSFFEMQGILSEVHKN